MKEKYKTVTCPQCGRDFRVMLRIGEMEFKDGYHGNCWGPHCDYWYFEAIIKMSDCFEAEYSPQATARV